MKILITGGSSGLGKVLVEQLSKEQEHQILFTYCHNKKVAQDLAEAYTLVKTARVDFCNVNSLEEFIATIENEEIDVLVNNAYTGNPQGVLFHKTEAEDYMKAFCDNVLPLIKITQTCISGMRKRKYGKIINIITSSIIDLPPLGYSVYASTKAYIRQLSKSICKEYGRFNITSNCILPDYMTTDFAHVEEFQLEQMINAHPLKRLLTPEEVAQTICHIIHTSQQLNGVEIPINAAQHLI